MTAPLKWICQLIPSLAIVAIVLSGVGAHTQTRPDSAGPLPPLIQSVKGPDLFRAYCAPCHGDGRTPGPVASSLKTRVPDLTLLRRNHAGQFPDARVRQTILGDNVISAHGTREMPIWGPVFHQVEGDMDWGNVRVENLLKYLQSIQR